MTEVEKSLAIVVIGRNEGERLGFSLQSALKACPNVVYADSASSDDSLNIARSLGVIAVSVDGSAPQNAARGRNAGFAAVRQHAPTCEFVQFMDGDCILVDGWVETALKFLYAKPKAAVVCGRRFEAHPEVSLYNRLADEEWDTPVGLAQACGGDSMIRMKALEEVGGFNPCLMASEEPELTARLRQRGWEIWRIDALMTEHDARLLTFAQWWRRTTRTGYGYAQAWLSTRDLAEPVNQRLLSSATVWVLVIPLFAAVSAFVFRNIALLFVLPLIYLAQVIRLTVRSRDLSFHRLKASCMMMLAKIPEFIGATRAVLWPRQSAMIEYKDATGATRRGG